MRVLNCVRHLAATKYVLLDDGSADPRSAGYVVAWYFLGDPVGLPCGGELFPPPMEDVRAYFEAEYAFDPAGWVELPPPLEGCREDCVAAIPKG